MLEKENLGEMFHKTKERIRELGEVFTPEEYVESMLDLLAKGKRNYWEKENIAFFEPTCGHGNIVIPLLNRRLKAIYTKALKEKTADPELYSIANSINTLWAIDIDKENVAQCRGRVFQLICSFIQSTNPKINLLDYIKQKIDFFAHLLCSINWHIYENEALSSLSAPSEAHSQANKTKLGAAWYERHEHSSVEFHLSWVEHFKACDSKGLIPLDYERALSFLGNYFTGSLKGQNNFQFTKSLPPFKTISKIKRSKTLEVGA